MSVILDALHKARRDRSPAAPTDGAAHEQAVARVVDAAAIPTPSIAAVPPQSSSRQWLLPVALILALVVVFALVGAGFLLIYNEIKQSAAQAGQRASADAAAPPALAAGQQFVGVPVIMPTPMPLSELPVQEPAAKAESAAPASPALTAADFTLGSIVCENNDCLASLNGRSVRQGDTVKGYLVTEITPSGLRMKQVGGTNELVLSLFD